MPCSAIFQTFPTDRGLCCIFNIKSANEIFVDSEYSELLLELQGTDKEGAFEKISMPDSYIQNKEPNTQIGRNMGLQLILDAHSDSVESVSVASEFEGFTGLITNSESFPLTGLSGFGVKAGHTNLIAVSAQLIEADEDLRSLKPKARKCLFSDETSKMTLHRSYRQENCFLECSLIYAQNILREEQNLSQGCTPWYFPFVDEAFSLCNPWQTVRISEIMQDEVPSEACSYCLPDCRRIVYRQSISTQPFRRCDERNLELTDHCSVLSKDTIKPEIWGRQVLENYKSVNGSIPDFLSNITSSKRTIKKSFLLNNLFPGISREYDAFEKDIAIVEIFFDTSTVMSFNSESRQSWIDYLSSVGGALGLCIGLSFVTLIELSWVSLKMFYLCHLELIDPDRIEPF